MLYLQCNKSRPKSFTLTSAKKKKKQCWVKQVMGGGGSQNQSEEFHFAYNK